MSVVFAQKWKNIRSWQYDGHQRLQHNHLTLQQLGYYGAQNCTLHECCELKAYGHVIKIWSLPLTDAWRKSFVVNADVCHHVIFFFFLTQLFTLSAKQDVNREHNTNKEGIFRWKYLIFNAFFPPTRPKEKYDGHSFTTTFFFSSKQKH